MVLIGGEGRRGEREGGEREGGERGKAKVKKNSNIFTNGVGLPRSW